VEPRRLLVKDEVRTAGRELGIPEYLVSRQPFPGPGLGIRIIGDVTEEKVKIVQEADAIYREEVDKAGVKAFRCFVNGQNILTFSPIRKQYNLDPENLSGLYPALKSFNAGVSVTF
jgi:GMP synthase PP-ATPase subunit